MIKRVLLISLFFWVSHSMAQFYVTGVEPFSTKWRQINTNNFRIIFPVDAERIAVRYANLLSVIDTVAPKSLNSKQRSFDVVVHNHSTLSNGFVAWAPKRMEIIAQPPSSTNSQLWLTQLALHESRHVSQLFKLNGGMVKPLSLFFGEQIVGASAGLVPSWFLEGDAVAFETAASNTGRGRQADFNQYYRAHFLSKTKKFNYDKWLMGSFRDNIPNHYNFGYQLVSYAKVEYGNQVWANTLKYVSHYPFTIFPFYFGLKKETGVSRKQLYEKTFNHLDSLWTFQQEEQELIRYQQLTKDNNEYTDYRYPYMITDSSIIAYKTNLSSTPRFVSIDLKTKKEKTIVQPGYLTSNPTYYQKNLFWTEYLPHIRWEYKNYSIIKSCNTATGEVKTISDRGRYFSPTYNSKDGFIYAISGNDDGSNTIVSFNLKGEKQKIIYLPLYSQLFELTFNAEKQQLIAGVVSEKGKSIVSVNQDGRLEIIYGPTYLDIHSVTSTGEHIVFSTSSGNKEDVFAFNMQTKEIYQLTKSQFGATDPRYASKSNRVVFSNFTSNGYVLSESNVDTSTAVTLSSINDDVFTRKLRATENFNIDSVDIPNDSFQINKYKGLKTLVNIHSWTPFYYDINQLAGGEVNIKPGITIYSQNLTGSSILTAGYGYDKVHLTRINYQYYGLFPVFSFQLELSGYSPVVHSIANTTLPSTVKQRKESTLSVYLPLTLTANRFTTVVYPFFQLISSNDYLLSTNDSLYLKGFQRFNYRVYFSSLQSKAQKNIRPRLGVEADINLENAPFNRNNFGSLLSSTFTIYLPGIGINHSLLLRQSLQRQYLQQHFLSNKVIFPRGYYDFPSEKFISISADYLMPIAYPDIAIGSFVYLKRISLNAFYDYAVNEFPTSNGKYTYRMKSTGFEIFTDVNFLRTRYPIRLKFQQGWAGDNLLPFNSFTIAVDFYGQ